MLIWKLRFTTSAFTYGLPDPNHFEAIKIDSNNVLGNGKKITGIKKTLENSGDEMHFVIYAA